MLRHVKVISRISEYMEFMFPTIWPLFHSLVMRAYVSCRKSLTIINTKENLGRTVPRIDHEKIYCLQLLLIAAEAVIKDSF